MMERLVRDEEAFLKTTTAKTQKEYGIEIWLGDPSLGEVRCISMWKLRAGENFL